MSNQNGQPVGLPTYTAHAASASAAAGAAVAILAWILEMNHIQMPGEVTAAFVVLFSPVASVLMKKLDILSS